LATEFLKEINFNPKISKNSIIYIAIIVFVFPFIGSSFADSSNSVKVAKDSERQNVKIKERYKHQNGLPITRPHMDIKPNLNIVIIPAIIFIMMPKKACIFI